jgi:hypothetical protein
MVNFSEFVPDGFGTADVAIYSNRHGVIADLKFGKGVKVTAEDNDQLKLYALGFYSILKQNNVEVDRFTLIIHQPRLDNVSTWEISISELLIWANSIVVPKAKMAYAGEGTLLMGDWCKFCRHKVNCNVMISEFSILDKIVADPDNVDSDVVTKNVLEHGDNIISFINSVKKHALGRALQGNAPKGFKVVLGGSKRFITDKEEVASMLISSGFAEDDVYEKKLIALTNLEKLVGKKTFSECFDSFVKRTSGVPSLVVESDKRDAISNADEFLTYVDEEIDSEDE